MDSYREELWALFEEESGASLVAINALVTDRATISDRDDLAELVRLFNLLGELSNALLIENMSHLAGANAWLVVTLKEQNRPISLLHGELLRTSLDTLREEREYALAQRRGGASATALIAEIKQETDWLSMPSRLSPSLAADPEPLRLFAALVTKESEALVAPLLADNAASRHTAQEVVETLRGGAEEIGFSNGAASFALLAKSIPQEHSTADEREQYVKQLAFIHGMLAQAAVALGFECGATALARAATAVLRTPTVALIEEIAKGVAAHAGPMPDIALAESIVEKLGVLADHLSLVHPFIGAQGLVLTLQDIYNRMVLENLQPRDDFGAIATNALENVARVCQDAQQKRYSVTEGVFDEWRQKLLTATQNHEGRKGRESFAESLATLRGVGVRHDFLALLTPENIDTLDVELKKGAWLYEVTVDLESNEEVTGAFINWTEEAMVPITSRSVIIGKESRFEFLLAGRHNAATVSVALKDIDPSGRYITFSGAAVSPPL